MRVRVRRVAVAAVAVAAVASGVVITSSSSTLAANKSLDGASADPACASPDDRCITAIAYADPAKMTVSTDGDRVVYQWDPTAIASSESLASPLTVAEAQQRAADSARSRGLEIRQPAPPSASSARAADPRASQKMRASASQYSGMCVGSASRPRIVSLGGTSYHMHAESSQYCNGNVSTHALYTAVYRDNVNRNADSDLGFNGESIATDAYVTCYNLGDIHTWWNYSDFSATTTSGTFVQGPAGFFQPVDHHCT
jgi:hypothetical protein